MQISDCYPMKNMVHAFKIHTRTILRSNILVKIAALQKQSVILVENSLLTYPDSMFQA